MNHDGGLSDGYSLASPGGAIISECGAYRYRLHRRWLGGEGFALFVMLNPSTADASADDPTIRRCIDFAKRWGRCGIIVINLFAYRATSPANLVKAVDPVGPENDNIILSTAVRFRNWPSHLQVVFAWGAHAKTAERATAVHKIFEHYGLAPMCLGTTKAGHPRHPLYVPSSTPLVPFRRPS